MSRTLIVAGLVWLFSIGPWCTYAVGQPETPELMKREVSREAIEYLQKLRKNTPFGTDDFNLAALRAGMGTRRLPTVKDVKLSKVKVGDISCEWVVAPGADPDLRLLYIHGGGFVSGSGGFYLAQAAHISAAAKCAILLPDYRLAPEHPFPAGLDDCVLTHQWMVANGPTGPGSARATFVAGDSAGGNLTLATLLALRDRKLKRPAGGIAISPCTDFTLASDSLKTVHDPIISAKTMPVFRDHYLGKTDAKNPLASPVFGDYRGLPPLLIQAGEHEMLRDDSIRVARKAHADGISVTLEVWPGMFHVFQSHEPLLPEAGEAIDHIAKFMRSSLDAPVSATAPNEELIGHWPLAGDTKDVSGNGRHAINYGVVFQTARPGDKSRAAAFNGRGNYLEVKSVPGLRVGTGDFTIALWVHTEDELDDDLGDLVTLYDPKKRIGFNLSLRTNAGVTTSQANVRQLQFGIDSGSEPNWVDEGRPGNATIAFALTVHDGKLYAGTAADGKTDAGRVYRYDGPGAWVDCGAPDKCNAISALAVHQGRLYAGSSKYRFAGSALKESENTHRGGRIYRHDSNTRWTEVGQLPDTQAVGGLVVFKGRLYASSLYKPAGFFRYESDGKWTSLAVPDGKRVESLGVFNGYLWATSYDDGRVYRYDGNSWKDFGRLGENTQTYSFATHRGQLCVGTWPSGKVFRLKDEGWEDLGRLGTELEVMGMLVHNGKLYAGTLPLAEVYRYEDGQTWTKLVQLDKTPDVKYRRAWTMAQYQGRLYCSTLPSGRVHSLHAGPCVTHDRELPCGWHHVAAVKGRGTLRTYVDGKLVAESAKFDASKLDLNAEVPLLIGAGAADSFRGSLRDVRLVRRALSSQEISRLANQ